MSDGPQLNGIEPTRVMVVDDQVLFREALRTVFESEADLRLVAEVTLGRDVRPEADRTRPHIILLNADLGGCDTIALAGELKEGMPSGGVIFLTQRDDVGFLVDAIKAGARGFITKESRLRGFIDSVRAVRAGRMVVPDGMVSDLVDRLLQQAATYDEALKRIHQLTARERSVLALLSQGHGNNAVAKMLYISPHTARTHIQNVITKLGVHSRLEAAMFVVQNGIFDELAAETA